MGLFNQVFGTSSEAKVAMNSAEAFAAICLVAIASDGYLSESEEIEMKSRLRRMQLFKGGDEENLDKVKTYLIKSLKQHGPNELIKSAQSALPPELASTAFATAADLVFADGSIARQEQAFLNDLRQILKIPDDLALKIVEVMTLKNKG